jgi:hypothetical protein
MSHRRLTAAVLLTGLLILPGCGRPVGNAPGAPQDGQSPTSRVTSEPTRPSDSPSAEASQAPGASPSARASDQPSAKSGGASDTPSADPSQGEDGQAGSDADENAQPTKSGQQTAVLGRVAGKTSSTCVSVGSGRDLRSGGFLGGPFDTARAQYGHAQPGQSKRTVRLYFVPLHAGTMPGVTLKFTNLQTGRTVTTRQKQVADAEQWKFYDTTTVLKSGGTWRVRAVAGSDKGCFVFELPQRG